MYLFELPMNRLIRSQIELILGSQFFILVQKSNSNLDTHTVVVLCNAISEKVCSKSEKISNYDMSEQNIEKKAKESEIKRESFRSKATKILEHKSSEARNRIALLSIRTHIFSSLSSLHIFSLPTLSLPLFLILTHTLGYYQF